jgi:hypothetical protein
MFTKRWHACHLFGEMIFQSTDSPSQTGVIFYPGARVDALSYTPTLDWLGQLSTP